MSEPAASISDVLGHTPDDGHAFKHDWDSMSDSNARGWCEVPVDAIIQRLVSADAHWNVKTISAEQEPFVGTSCLVLFHKLKHTHESCGR